jgi:autotransporter-associated beta strand protein
VNSLRLAPPVRPLCLALLVALAAGGPAHAQSWSNVAAGTYSWNTTASWGGSAFPNAVDASATMGVDITGDQTINLGQAITVGSLTYGDTNSSNVMTIAAGNSLTFSVSSGGATFTTSANTNNNAINAAVVLASPLSVTHAGTGLMTFGGVVSGTGSLTTLGTGTVVLSGANTFTGGSVVTAGTLRGTVAGAFGGNTTAAAVTLAGGSLDLFNNTGTTFTNANVTVTANATVISNRSTAGAGVTHTLGTLTIGGATLAVTRGANATSGVGGVVFGDVTLTGNAVFAPAANTLLTVGAINGAFGVTQNGSTTTVVTGAGTYSGGTTLVASTIQANNNSALGTGDVNFPTGSTGRLTINGGVTVANNVSVAAGVSGVTGVGLIQGIGTGQAVFNGTLTLGGVTTSGGVLLGVNAAGSELVMGGPINQTGANVGLSQRAGRVIYKGGGNLTGNFNVTDTAFVGATNGIPTGLSPTLAGSGSATLDLATFGFDQALAGLTLGNSGSAFTSTVNIGAHTLTLNGNVASISGATQLVTHAFNTTAGGAIAVGAAGSTFTVADSQATNDVVVNGAAISGAGGLTKAGPGTLVLRNVTLAGPLTVNAGTVAPSLASGTGGTLTTSALAFGPGPTTVRMSVAGAGDIINGGTVTTTAGGTVSFALSGNNGATVVNGTYPLINYTGTSPGLSNFAIGSFGHATATLVDTGTAIAVNVTGFDRVVWTGATDGNWNGTTTNWQTQTGGAPTTFLPGDNVGFPDAPSGPGGTNITIAAPVAPGSVSVNADTTSYTFTASGANQIGGSGGLTKTGAATLTLTGANAYSGPTAVTGGTLAINGTNSIGDGSASNTIALSGGGRLSMTAGMDLGVNRSIAVGAGGGSLSYNATGAGTVTVGGNLTGTDPLSFQSNAAGAGTFVLNGNNAGYTGNITVDVASTGITALRIGTPTAAPGGGSITLNYAAGGASGSATTLDLPGTSVPATVTLNMTTLQNGGTSLRSQVTSSGTAALNGPITLSGSAIAQITPAAGGTMTINGNVTEATPGGFTGFFIVRGAGTGVVNGTINLPTGTVSKTDGGVWTFNSSAGNNWTLTQILSSGSVRLGATNAFPAGALLQIGQASDNASSLLEMNGFDLTVNGLTWIAGTGSNARAVGNSSATLSTLTVNSATNQAYGATTGNTGGLLTGNLRLVKAGTSTQTLGGANTYTGGTQINAGTLTVTNTTGSGTGTGSVTVAGGGILNGTGILAPTGGNGVTVQPGGTLKAGTSPGVLTISPAAGGAVTLAAGSTFAVDVQGTTPGNTATNHGQLVVTAGTLDLGGSTLSATFSGYAPSAADTINIINYTGATLANTFNGLPDGAVAYPNVLGSGIDYRIFYGTLVPNRVTLSPVPEPAACLSVACAGFAAAAVARRRRTRGAGDGATVLPTPGAEHNSG